MQVLGLLNQWPHPVAGESSLSTILTRSMIIIHIGQIQIINTNTNNNKTNTNINTNSRTNARTNTNMNTDRSQLGASGRANGGCEVH